MRYESTQFARVMRELGIQQIFAMSPQAKGRVERMASTFQDRLVTELRLASATTMEEANQVLQEFLPRFNRRFALTPEQPETAYRPVSEDLSLTETVSIQHTRKVARDNTVHYQWRVLQLLPGAERPSYAGLQVEVLERSDGELIIRYQGETVDSQERDPPASALWGEGTCRFPTLRDRRKLKTRLAVTWMRPSGSSWPNWTPRWSSGPKPRPLPPKGSPFATSSSAGLPLPSRPDGRRCSRPKAGDCPCGLSPRNWGCLGWPPGNMPWPRAHQPNCSAPRSGPRPKTLSWTNHRWPQTNPGDIFAFQERGRNRWTTTHFAHYWTIVLGVLQ